jgi:AcrR family transcriptional regulator
MDAAVELFEDAGFSGTNLNQIIRRARVTPGAFYYHFASKEEVALAIIDQVAQRMAELRTAFVGAAESGLESVIELTFQLSLLLSQDRSYRVAAHLEHTVVRHSRQGIQDVAERIDVLVAGVAQAIRASPLRDGVPPEEAARTMVSMIYGCLAMTDLMTGDIATRLDECWRILLPGLVAPDSLAYFQNTLWGTFTRSRQAGVVGA